MITGRARGYACPDSFLWMDQVSNMPSSVISCFNVIFKSRGEYRKSSTKFRGDNKPNTTKRQWNQPLALILATYHSSVIILCLCQAAVQCPSLWLTFRPNKSLLAQTEPQGNGWLPIKHQGKSIWFFNWLSTVLHCIFSIMSLHSRTL